MTSKRTARVAGINLRRSRGRRYGQLSPRKKFLIVTEGKTEAIYFRHFRSSTGPEVVVVDGSDNKRSLVVRAIEIRQERTRTGDFDADFDELWVVLDRDTHPSNPKDKTNFNEALQVADNEGANIAYSNDSFELWLLLHFQDLDTAMHRTDIARKLSTHIKRPYRKDGSCDLFDEIHVEQASAIRRAEKLLEQLAGAAPVDANPSTTVHKLVAKLIEEGDHSSH